MFLAIYIESIVSTLCLITLLVLMAFYAVVTESGGLARKPDMAEYRRRTHAVPGVVRGPPPLLTALSGRVERFA